MGWPHPVNHEEVISFYRARRGRTLREVGEEFGITRERVRQILERYDVPRWRKHGGWTRREMQRVIYAVARAAWLAEFEAEHGTTRRYRGLFNESDGVVIPPCRCQTCRDGNTRRCYESSGFVPKFGQRRYQQYVKQYGIPHHPVTVAEINKTKEN